MKDTIPHLEGYQECHLCTVPDKTRAHRCRYCTGAIGVRDILYLDIEKRWRRKVAPYLSALLPGLGHWYRGKRYVGTFFFSLIPLAAGLVLATFRSWNWGLSALSLGGVVVWILALLDSRLGPYRYFPPCQEACPAGVRCSQYVHLLSEGKYKEALETVEIHCPFPGTIGRVCHHPCEQACNRGKDGDPVSICALKRFADDHVTRPYNFYKREIEKNPAFVGRRIAVVGSGPSGLSACLYLRLLGFDVTLLESREVPGGTPRFYLAGYRLPPEVYSREVDRILELGVDLRLGKTLGKDFTLEDLAGEGFAGIYVAIGAMRSIRLPHTGKEEEGFLDGRIFLEKALSPEGFRLHGRVLVIGGGNVAMDVARTALRCGAEKASMICLETRETMPAHPWETAEAVREGVELYPAGATVSFEREGERIRTACCQEVERIDKDPSGRLVPVLKTGEGYRVAADWIITAVGSAPDWSFLGGRPPLRLLHPKVPLALLEKKETSRVPILFGGDVVKGPTSVVEAIGAGREAAYWFYRRLVGSPPVSILFTSRRILFPFPNYSDSEAKRRRIEQAEVPADRRSTFDEVYRGFAERKGREEADRCTRCDWPLASEKKAKRAAEAMRKQEEKRARAGGI